MVGQGGPGLGLERPELCLRISPPASYLSPALYSATPLLRTESKALHLFWRERERERESVCVCVCIRTSTMDHGLSKGLRTDNPLSNPL